MGGWIRRGWIWRFWGAPIFRLEVPKCEKNASSNSLNLSVSLMT